MPLTMTRHPRVLQLASSLAVALSLLAHARGTEAQETSSVMVHGQWTIELRNPDGTLSERREFQNALVGSGAEILAQVLARADRAGRWAVALSGVGPCSIAGGVAAECFVAEAPIPRDPGPLLPDPFYLFYTLTASVPTSGSNIGRLVLVGHATATSSDSGLLINKVATWLNTCALPAGPCSGTQFSEKSIPPLAVVKGQIIQVTVVFSFQ
jgi:hypothetical protein